MTFVRKKITEIILGIFIISNILAWSAVFYCLDKTNNLKVVFFDVGQGDAIFIETPQGHQILIDGGPSVAILEKLGDELPFFDRSLDMIILTHPHSDHIFGLIEVLKYYQVDNILWTGIVENNAIWEKWNEIIKDAESNVKIAEFGQRIKFQTDPLIYMDILYPFDNLEGKMFSDANDSSIVNRLVFGNISFLFTGDIGFKIEDEIIEKEGIDLDSNVLKVAHHGSRYSSSKIFIENVLPDLAVIQVGENRFGHPHSEVLARFEEFGIQVLTNKEMGNIEVISNGSDFLVKNY